MTQFTYFQQAGGKTLDAPAVEITYGLERILMALQGVTTFRDIRYNDSVTYGELFLQNEYEMSVFNLDEADVAEQRARCVLMKCVCVCACMCVCVCVCAPHLSAVAVCSTQRMMGNCSVQCLWSHASVARHIVVGAHSSGHIGGT